MASVINGTNIVLYEYANDAQFFLNGSVSEGSIDGGPYYQFSPNKIVGTSVDFPKVGNGTIAQFITDPGLAIPSFDADVWTITSYLSLTTNITGSPFFYYAFYKYNGTTFTLIAESAYKYFTSISKTVYTTTLSMPSTAFASGERLAVKVIGFDIGSRTATLFTQSTNATTVQTNLPSAVPFSASTNCVFSTSVDQNEITTYASNSYKEYIGSQINWDISGDGFMSLSDYSYLFLLNKLQLKEKITVKFSINNDNGDGSGLLGYSVFTGSCNIVSLDMSAPVEGASTYSVKLQGTGAYAISGTQVITGGTTISTSSVTTDSTIAAGGEYTLTFIGAIGSTCISVTRGGLEVRTILTSGTPTGEDVKFNTITGVLTFARALESDEFVRATFK